MAETSRKLRDSDFDHTKLRGQPSDIGTLGIQRSPVPTVIFAFMVIVVLVGAFSGHS